MRRRNERGAALLAVLLLVAVTGAIAVAAMEKLALGRATAANATALAQARTHAAGIEALAALTIDDMIARSPDKTSLAGDWNGAVRRVPLPDGGLAEARVRDGGNCFNLNSLVSGDPRTGLARRPTGIRQLAGLMALAGVPEAEATRLAEGAADLIDSDTRSGATGGTESAASVDTLIEEVDELRLVPGFGVRLEALRPWLCVLPVADLSPININTLAPDQAPLLAMLAPGQLDPARARAVLASRPAEGWDSAVDFWRSLGLRDLAVPLDAQLQPQVRSRWFRLDVRVALDEVEFAEQVLIDARLQPSRLVARRWQD